MSTSSTVHGITTPEGSDDNDSVAAISAVITSLEGGSLVKRLSAATISGLSAGQKPAGLVVYNTTTGKLQVSNGSTFADVADATKLPLAGGTMTGDLTMNVTAGSNRFVNLHRDSVLRWRVGLVDAGGLGCDFYLQRFNSSGEFVDTPLIVEGETGQLRSNSHTGGTHTATTGGSGEVTLTLPTSPTGNWAVTVTGTAVDGTGGTGYAPLFYVTATSSTSATVRAARSSNGAYITGTSVTFLYTAVAY